MTVRTPIVLVGREHVPLAADDTLNVKVQVSGSEDNILSTTPDGLLAELHVDPTGIVQLLGKGTPLNPLTGELLLDTADGNLITTSPDGLMVSVTGGKGQTASFSGGTGTSLDPLVVEVTLAGDEGQRIQVLEDKGLYVAPEAVSTDAGNGLERRENGLFVSSSGDSISHDNSLTGDGTDEAPLKVWLSNKADNKLVNTDAGLYVAPLQESLNTANTNRLVRKTDGTLYVPNVGGATTTTAKVSVEPKAIGGNTAVDVQSVGVDIVFSAQKANIASASSDGVFVNGLHNIIPKFYASTVYLLIAEDQTTTYPDGSIRTESTWSGVNPPAVGGVGAYVVQSIQSQVRLMDAAGNPVRLQLEMVRVSGANWKMVALMSARPVSAYYLSNNNAYPGTGELNNFPVSVMMLYGYNPTQLGMV